MHFSGEFRVRWYYILKKLNKNALPKQSNKTQK